MSPCNRQTPPVLYPNQYTVDCHTVKWHLNIATMPPIPVVLLNPEIGLVGRCWRAGGTWRRAPGSRDDREEEATPATAFSNDNKSIRVIRRNPCNSCSPSWSAGAIRPVTSAQAFLHSA